MANEVIEFPQRQDSNMPVTSDDVQKLARQRELLKSFVSSQLRENVDFGTIPGTPKATLFKPGAEKLARLFGLGVKVALADKTIDRESNFAMFTYKATLYPLNNPGVVIAECEGSCNSQEKKYRERYTKGGGKEETPIFDILNTLQKMAQKRAIVGCTILAVAGSDFFTQDIDDPEDAKQQGIKPEPARAQASVPKATAAASHDQANTSAPVPGPDAMQACGLCGATLRLSQRGDAYTCPNWKDKSKGNHSYITK